MVFGLALARVPWLGLEAKKEADVLNKISLVLGLTLSGLGFIVFCPHYFVVDIMCALVITEQWSACNQY